MEIAEALAEVEAKTKDYLEVKQLLEDLPKQLKHPVMIPLSGVGFVEGDFVHTNEFLVALGDGWFRTATAFQATEIVDRRLQILEVERKRFEDMSKPKPKRDFEELMGRMRLLEEEEKSGSSAVNSTIKEKEVAPPAASEAPVKERVSKFKQERSRAS
mmetsp:Transcript_24996/g.43866  ORF Transcript_24996/g.43866 Transcript_24996/m.43866 type:complete len:158 (-) Transcript_24996:996-1469(-)|eukprot:CAMPEP_0204912242 /NCGR_PEP_ID=MMETSP1397-20131031/10420_1 /ASSEMBLY_ACC=CAM_ASM_000891 /TAXON_ID=49980 /ORGANISM="Climacostomum Climacostomum virens, Strain Stock W-24" /LENGTH=157 /DNA_ID=CAMNT_0052083117 /DNA_START=422 /DNA_END=895 /DNA_ORIENTATION=-